MPLNPNIPLSVSRETLDVSPLQALVQQKREDERSQQQQGLQREGLQLQRETLQQRQSQQMQKQQQIEQERIRKESEAFEKETQDNAIREFIKADEIFKGGITPENVERVKGIALKRKERLQSGIDRGLSVVNGTDETDQFIQLLETDPQSARDFISQGIAVAEREGLIKADPTEPKAAGVDQVQSSKILPGGVTQLVYKSGKIETKTPSEANEELIKAAEERGAELQGLRAGERGAASEAIKSSVASFKTLGDVRKNIRNIDEGIRLLDEGAKTGAIEGRLPSIRSASVKLANLKGRLGLDVIGAVTFGALSEAELQFALDTALPTKLDEEELKQWLTEKRDAQHKLATNLEEAALFLGTPGNTIAEFIQMKKEERDRLTPEEQAELDELKARFGGQ